MRSPAAPMTSGAGSLIEPKNSGAGKGAIGEVFTEDMDPKRNTAVLFVFSLLLLICWFYMGASLGLLNVGCRRFSDPGCIMKIRCCA